MANIDRGELTIEFNGVDYIMRPDFNFIREVEQATSYGIYGILTTIGNIERCNLTHIISIIWAGLRSGGCTEFSLEQVHKLIINKGFVPCSLLASKLLSLSIASDADIAATAAKMAAKEETEKSDTEEAPDLKKSST